MKFGKILRRHTDAAFPEWRDKFLSYKYLKKRLNFMSSASETTEVRDASQVPNKRRRIDTQQCRSGSVQRSSDDSKQGADEAGRGCECVVIPLILTAEESDFVDLLKPELHKFNLFFLDKEEEYIIRQKELQDRFEMVKNGSGPNGMFPCEGDYNREMIKIGKDIVNFHGEMVLLENYSTLNYTGLMKIVKKYDKRTGGVLRLSFIDRVLQQPFFTTDILSKLVKECENTLQHLFPSKEQTGELDVKRASNVAFNCSCNCKEGSVLHRSIVAAVRTIIEMRIGSCT